MSFKPDPVPVYRLKALKHSFLKGIPEPSDIVFDAETGHFFIVSDHGILFECDSSGLVLHRAKEEGMDFEGVEVKGVHIYVSDESGRKVYKYRKSDLFLEQTYQVYWGGPMNNSYESIAYNNTKNCFVLISEKPPTVVEYDTTFKELAQYPLGFTRDINGCRWHGGSLYMVSNGNASVFKCDPVHYKPEAIYKVNILDPEGIAFGRNGNVFITSDNEQRLYVFNTLPNTPQNK